MNIPRLQMSQTFGQLSIRQKKGGVEIQQPQAKIEISSTKPEVVIRRSPSDLQIDQSRAWAAYGIMNPVEMTKRINGAARQVVLDTIARIAQDGDRMAAIHQSTDVIPDLAEERASEFREMQFAGEASYLNVDVRYTPAQLSFHPIQGQVSIEVQPQKPIIERIPAKVDIAVERYPMLKIDWIGQKVDRLL